MRALNKAILIGLTGLIPFAAIGQSAANTYDCGNPPALVKQAIEQIKGQGASVASKYFMKNPDAAKAVSNYWQQCSSEEPAFLGGFGCDICEGTLVLSCGDGIFTPLEIAEAIKSLLAGKGVNPTLEKCIVSHCGSACSIP